MGESFAWTIPLVLAGIATLFFAARRMGAAAEARWWGCAFFLSAGAFTLSLPLGVLGPTIQALMADTLFAVSFYVYAGALLVRHGRADARTLRLSLLAVAIAAPAVAILGRASLEAELVLSDTTCSAQIVAALLMVPRWPARRVDRVLVSLSWLMVADNTLRSASLPLTIADASIHGFLASPYNYLMYANALLIGFSLGLVGLIAVTGDMIAAHRRDAAADPLTGLLNRRGLEAAAGAGRDGRTDVVLSCDLDHFKRVNDTLGHEAGDAVLQTFADLARSVLPPKGVAARTGGEEFVLYLPGHSPGDGALVAARLKAAMARTDWSRLGLDWAQTASFGLALRTGGASTLPGAMREADACLYDAKRNGRDQLRSAA